MTDIINGEAVRGSRDRSKSNLAANPAAVNRSKKPQTTRSNEIFGPVATVSLALRLRSLSRKTGAVVPSGLFDLLKHHASGGDEACALILMDLTTKTGGQQHA